ncbi:hypothetical protein ACOMHN_027373 [Nucella lapillus]
MTQMLILLQICTSRTEVRSATTRHEACQTDTVPFNLSPSEQSHHHHFKSENRPAKTVALEDTEAALESFDENSAAVCNDDHMDDENCARKSAESSEIKADVKPENENVSEPGAEETQEGTHLCQVAESFMCEFCLQIFYDPDQLVRHIQTHSGNMLHECSQCRARFFQENVLQLHTETHSQEKRQHCDQCSASFSRLCGLTKHVERVHEAGPENRGSVVSNLTLAASHHQENAVNMMEEETGEKVQEKWVSHQECEESVLQCDVSNLTEEEALSKVPENWPNHQESEELDLQCDIPIGEQQRVPSHNIDDDTGAAGSCGSELEEQQHLDHHALTHIKEKRHGCQFCGAAFTQLNGLVGHMRSHYSHKPFLCGKCHKSFRGMAYMSRHVCKGNRTQCGLCGEKFDQSTVHSCPEESCGNSEISGAADQDVGREADHQKLNKGRKKSATLRKNEASTSKKARGRPPKNDRHNAEIKGEALGADQHKPSSEDTGEETHPHCCDFCGARFMFLTHLARHQQEHTGQKAFQCSHCAQSFKSMAFLANHLRAHTDSKNFPCQYCGKILKSLFTLKEHLRSHTGEKPFECATCGSCFTLSSTYKAHLRVHTGDRPYLCPHCGKSFVRSSNLSVHIRACTGDKPYTCTECGKSFSDVGYYKKHVDNHAGIKPYKCEYCGKAFSQSTSLKLHIRTHTGEKPHKCPKCPMAFAIPNSLTEHMRKHSGDKPYKCSICGKGFAKSSNRLAHFRTHNKNKQATVPYQGTGTADGVSAFSLSVV